MPILLPALALLGEGPPPAIDGGPRLRARPSAQDMADAYPREALRDGIRGRVVITCHLTAEGKLTACTVTEQTPPGMGFGAATLKIAPLFRWAPTYGGGKPVEGDVRIPVMWNPPSPPN